MAPFEGELFGFFEGDLALGEGGPGEWAWLLRGREHAVGCSLCEEEVASPALGSFNRGSDSEASGDRNR